MISCVSRPFSKCQFSLCLPHTHTPHSNCQGWLMQSIRAVSFTVASSDRLQNLWVSGLCRGKMRGLIFLFLLAPFSSIRLRATPPSPFLYMTGGAGVCSNERSNSGHIHGCSVQFCFSLVSMDQIRQVGRLMKGSHILQAIPSIFIVCPILMKIEVWLYSHEYIYVWFSFLGFFLLLHYCVFPSVPTGWIWIVNILIFYGSSVESAGVTQAAIKVCGNVCVCVLKWNENDASIRTAYHPTILHFS